MALKKDDLKASLDDIQKNQPKSAIEAATKWANAIVNYAKQATPPPVIPVPATILPIALIQSFQGHMASMSFMDNLGPDLMQWWANVSWVSPGFTGVTNPPPPFVTSTLGQQISGGQIKDVADFLATQIDAWTKSIQVTVTSATGVTSVVPIL